MTAVDGTGLGAIEELAEDLRCGAPSQPAGATAQPIRYQLCHLPLNDQNAAS